MPKQINFKDFVHQMLNPRKAMRVLHPPVGRGIPIPKTKNNSVDADVADTALTDIFNTLKGATNDLKN